MNLSKFVEYVKVHAVWKNKPDKSTPVNANALMAIESGIKSNNEAINELAAAVVSTIANDPNKIANMAALYAVQQAAFQKANLVSQITNDANKAASMAALYSVNEELKRTNSNFAYQKGDVINIDNFVSAGFLTTSNTVIAFSVPISKPIATKKLQIKINGINVRQNGSYLINDTCADSVLSYSVRDSFIQITLRKSNGYGGTNNDAVGVELWDSTMTVVA